MATMTSGKNLNLPVRSVLFVVGLNLVLASGDVVIELTADTSGRDLFGISPVADGRIVILLAGSRSQSINIIGESVSATNANERFADSGTLDADEGRAYLYDGAISRWVRFL